MSACSCDWPGCQGQCHTGDTCPCHPSRDTETERTDPEPICMCRFDADCPDHGRPEFRRSQPASEPSLDVERLAEALWFEGLVNAPTPKDPTALEAASSLLGAIAGLNKHRLSQPTEPSETDQE